MLVHARRTLRRPQPCVSGESHAAQLTLLAAALKNPTAHAEHSQPCAAA